MHKQVLTRIMTRFVDNKRILFRLGLECHKLIG